MKDNNYDWEHKKHLAPKLALIISFTIIILAIIWTIFKLITGNYVSATLWPAGL